MTVGRLLSFGLTALIVLGLVLNVALFSGVKAGANTGVAVGPTIFFTLVAQVLCFLALLVVHARSYVQHGPVARLALPVLSGLAILASLVYVTSA